MSWRRLVAEAAERLAEAGVAEPDLSARRIGQRATGADGAEWLVAAEEGATKRQLAHFDVMVERRAAGEPLQYVVGSWGFRTLDLFLDRRVLIPRPETEVVTEQALVELRRVAAVEAGAGGEPEAEGTIAVDLGTGSGAIGLALAVEQSGIQVWLTDRSADALAVARANIAGLGWAGDVVRVAEGDWFEALPSELRGRIAVVVANPPYVADEADLDPQVAVWEPLEALVAAEGGTAHLRHLLAEAPAWLRAEGAVVLEMAPDQVVPMVEVAAERFAEVDRFNDLAGRARGLIARAPR